MTQCCCYIFESVSFQFYGLIVPRSYSNSLIVRFKFNNGCDLSFFFQILKRWSNLYFSTSMPGVRLSLNFYAVVFFW